MKMKIHFKVRSIIRAFEEWPINVGDFVVNYQIEDHIITGISIDFAIADADFPQVVEDLNPFSRIAASITIPEVAKLKEARAFLRRIQSFLSSVAPTTIDFNSERLEWIPENQEEKERLKLYGFSVSSEGTMYDDARELTFDFVAALTYNSYSASQQEIALSFVHKGNADYNDGKYISAFYNYFLSLETQFFAGYSDPKKVKIKIKANDRIAEALSDLRDAISFQRQNYKKQFTKLNGMTNNMIVDHIVDTRGNLHHHSSRGPASWHPDEPEVFEEEAFALKVLSGSIANTIVLSSTFSTERSSDFFEMCKKAGAVVSLIARGTEITYKGEARKFESKMNIPGIKPHAALVERLNNELRVQIGRRKSFPKEYVISDLNGVLVASYRRSELAS
ncbi:hypothetical protein [Pararhizobium sp.]|uniref:hypothetical protein n=1 Tax=Pararhizobium sp. TaxID=1977563 RepID=UPI003D09C7BF